MNKRLALLLALLLVILLVIVFGGGIYVVKRNTDAKRLQLLQKDFTYSIEDLGKDEYFYIYPFSNGITFEANFHADTCFDSDFSYARKNKHLKIIYNLTTNCVDLFTYTGIKGKIDNLETGDYKITIYTRYKENMKEYGMTTKLIEVISNNFTIQ